MPTRKAPSPPIDLTIDSQGSETQPMSDASPAPPMRAPQNAPSRVSSSPYKSALPVPSSGDATERPTSSPEPEDIPAAKKPTPIRPDQSSSVTILDVMITPKPIVPGTRGRKSNADFDITPKAPFPPPSNVARLRGDVDSGGASTSSTKRAAAELSLTTPKARSELPQALRKPRGPSALSSTEPRPGKDGRIAASGVVLGKGQIFADLGRPSADHNDSAIGSEKAKPDAKKQKADPKTSQRLLKYTSSPHILQSSSSPAGSPRKNTTGTLIRRPAAFATPGAGPSSSKPSLKGKEKEVPATTSRLVTSAMSREQREQHLEDLRKMPASDYKKAYSAFKGRGRYAQDGADDAFNSRYEINRERNGGMDQPYDEVVRAKAARKKLHAADCECCKDVSNLLMSFDLRSKLKNGGVRFRIG